MNKINNTHIMTQKPTPNQFILSRLSVSRSCEEGSMNIVRRVLKSLNKLGYISFNFLKKASSTWKAIFALHKGQSKLLFTLLVIAHVAIQSLQKLCSHDKVSFCCSSNSSKHIMQTLLSLLDCEAMSHPSWNVSIFSQTQHI